MGDLLPAGLGASRTCLLIILQRLLRDRAGTRANARSTLRRQCWPAGPRTVKAKLLLLLRPLDEILLENPCIARVCTEDGIGDIAEEGDETEAEVKYHVEVHPRQDGRRETAFDLGTRPDKHPSKEEIDEVADTREG